MMLCSVACIITGVVPGHFLPHRKLKTAAQPGIQSSGGQAKKHPVQTTAHMIQTVMNETRPPTIVAPP